ERMQQGAATLRADGTIVYCNESLAELIEVPHEQLIGAVLHDFVAAEDHTVYEDLFSQGLSESSRGEARLRRSDGRLVPAYLTLNRLPRDGGADLGVLVTDLTTQRHHEELAAAHKALRAQELRLLAKERQFQHISDHAAVLIAQCSRDLRFEFVNRACAEFLGRPSEQIIGKPIAEILGRDAFQAIRPYIDRVLAGEQVDYESEIPYSRKGPRWMRVIYVPDFDQLGEKVCGWIAAITDITERKRME